MAREYALAAIVAASISADGMRVAVAAGKEALIWDVATGKQVVTLPHGDVVRHELPIRYRYWLLYPYWSPYPTPYSRPYRLPYWLLFWPTP